MAGVVNLDRDGRSSPCDTLSFILDVRPAPGLPDRWGGTPQGRYGLSPFFFYSSLYQYPGRQPWLLWSRPGGGRSWPGPSLSGISAAIPGASACGRQKSAAKVGQRTEAASPKRAIAIS